MISGTCKYGTENCWLNNGERENTSKNEINEKLNGNEELIQKIFQMMEKKIHNKQWE